MPRTVAFTLLALVLSVPTPAFQRARKGKSTRNRTPIIRSFVSSNTVVEFCPFYQGSVGCGTSNSRVTLRVEARDRDNDELSYQYSVGFGDIEGEGSTVIWDIKRLGKHTARIEVSDPRGGRSSSTLSVEVIPCGECHPPRPWLEVVCPKDVTEGETAVFEAKINGDDYDGTRRRIFLWRHSLGKRITEPEGPTLRIQALGFPGEMITATVRVLGLEPTISSEASCRTKIVKQVQRAPQNVRNS